MGYQESWVYIEPQWNFKNLIRAYEQAEAAGYYNPCTHTRPHPNAHSRTHARADSSAYGSTHASPR